MKAEPQLDLGGRPRSEGSPARARPRARVGSVGFSSPEQTASVLAAALGKGDLDTAMACFAREGCFLTPDSTAIRGREDIRPVLAQLLASCTELRVDPRGMIVAGEVALGSERWTLSSRGAEGASFERSSTSLTVLRQVEGDWKLMILAPWSGGGD